MDGTILGAIVGFASVLFQQWIASRTPVSAPAPAGVPQGGVYAEGETCASGDDAPFASVDTPFRQRVLELMRGSVRPLVTHGFFWAWIGVKVGILVFAIQQSPAVLLPPIFWTESDEVLFATVLSYWFGSRVMTRWKR